MNNLGDLESVWDGFFEKIRNREFDEEQVEEVLRIVKSLDCEQEFLPKRLISMVWIMPLFLQWNKERCIEKGAKEQSYDNFVDRITEVVIHKLGTP